MKKTRKQNVIDYGKFALSLERNREKQLHNKSLVLTLINAVLIFATLYVHSRVAIFITLVNLIFLTQTQWFYKKYYLNHVTNYIDHINKQEEYGEDDWLNQQMSDYDKVEKGFCKSNDKRARFGMLSVILTDAAIVALIIELLLRV